MRELGIFNTVKITNSANITIKDFKDMKYGGFLTVSQSGKGDHLLRALKLAYENHLTCFNIVNIEDSPLTQALDNLVKNEEEKIRQRRKSNNVLYDASDDEDSSEFSLTNKNIGLYQKTGHCYSDIKSFIPQIVAVILAALWFSDNKQQQNLTDLETKKHTTEIRKQLISDIGYLSLRLKHTLQQSFIAQYKEIAQFLKKQDNIFLLSKGTGSIVSEFVAYKFN